MKTLVESNKNDEVDDDPLTRKIIGAAIEVHRSLGPGLLESVYQTCLERELHLNAIKFEAQRPVSFQYKGVQVTEGYRLDLVVENQVVVELKAVQKIEPIHEAQLLTYLKLTGFKVGLLINFNTILLKDGIKRRVN